ncbi:hypothetical protein, partial [Kitasatospora sp. LaBMicrA B282]|uniref:hypothetical protein n=1 Tax=Kitasatospora sp. LaBMicrA B282 TaxID=3420949 RepID=UPI003D0C24E9
MTPRSGAEAGSDNTTTTNTVTGGQVGQLVQARDVTINNLARPEPPRYTPRQIRPLRQGAAFVNRSAELAALTEALAELERGAGLVTVAFTGLGGVGKTELIAQWAERERERFPDGDLYADLAPGGHGDPVDPGEVLGRFLRALHVAKEYVPDSLAERGDLFRSITRGRRLLVFLDNVDQPAQVRTLLPGGGLLVLAGRRRLPALALPTARVLTVPPLTTGAGARLVRTWLGEDRGTEQELAELVDRCGGLPLALNAVGSQLIGRRQLTVRRVMAALAERPGESGVDEALDAVLAQLPEPARALHRVIGLLPAGRFTRELVETAAGGGPLDRALEDLAGAHLLDELPAAPPAAEGAADDPAEDRFGCHDLVHQHARRAAAELDEAATEAVQRRLVDYYRHRTALADRALGKRFRLQDPPAAALPTDRGPAPDWSGREKATVLDWLERESSTVLELLRTAARRGWHDAVWQLCESLWPLYHGRKLYADWIEAHELGVTAAGWAARPDAEIRMRNQLARAHYELGEHEAAAAQLAAAAELLPQVTEARLAGVLHESQGLLCLARGQAEQAVARFTEARRANAGDTHGLVVQGYNLAQALFALPDPERALAEVTAAAELAERTDDQVMTMRLDLLRGRLHEARGESAAALARFGAAADLGLQLGQWSKADQALELLAALAERVGEAEPAARSRARLRELRAAAGVLP